MFWDFWLSHHKIVAFSGKLFENAVLLANNLGHEKRGVEISFVIIQFWRELFQKFYKKKKNTNLKTVFKCSFEILPCLISFKIKKFLTFKWWSLLIFLEISTKVIFP